MDAAEHHGRVPALVAGRRILFVGGVMLFVHDDQTQVSVGQEEGGAGAEDDVRPFPDPCCDLLAPRGCFGRVEYE